MNKKERTWILVEDDNLSDLLVESKCQHYDITVIEEPRNALVMMKTREVAKNSLFYSGEVLVSYAKVKVGSEYGVGMILGNQLEKAKKLAIIDAIYPQLTPTESQEWIELLESAKVKLLTKLNKEQQAINQTKVSFDVMEVEDE